jgi:hypothetical protein
VEDWSDMKLEEYDDVVVDLGMLTIDVAEDITELFKSKFLDDAAHLEHLRGMLVLYQAATLKVIQNTKTD